MKKFCFIIFFPLLTFKFWQISQNVALDVNFFRGFQGFLEFAVWCAHVTIFYVSFIGNRNRINGFNVVQIYTNFNHFVFKFEFYFSLFWGFFPLPFFVLVMLDILLLFRVTRVVWLVPQLNSFVLQFYFFNSIV